MSKSGLIMTRSHEQTPLCTLETLPDPAWSLPQVLQGHATRDEECAALYEVTVTRAGVESDCVTYSTLLRRARQAARRLAALGVEPGDRVVLMVQQPSEFLGWFFGAMGLGAISVPLPPVGKLGVPASVHARIEGVSRDCRPRVIVADGARRLSDHYSDPDFDGIWLDPVDVAHAEDTEAPEHFDLQRALGEHAYLQYTSGSTGAPKGVVITHGNLVANLRASTLAGHFSSNDRCVSWLPLYHDMGLIGGPLLGIFLNAAPYLMNPTEFIMSPVSWLQALDRFKATFTVAPNFAYSIAAHKMSDKAIEGLDLSSIRLAFNGAEPIDHHTVARFLERFQAVGFDPRALYPVYGLAEATLAVAFPHPGEQVAYDCVDRKAMTAMGRAPSVDAVHPDAVTFVSVGQVVPEHEVLIRHPDTDAPCGERELGQIWVRGPSVSPGYFTPDFDTAEARNELATGDLGYLADDQLFVVDRLKDLIIVAGANYAPTDIERHIARVDGIRRGAVVAFALQGELGTECLHVVAEFDPKCMRRLDEVDRQLCQIVRAGFGLTVANVLLTPPHSLPKTSSGKIQRHQTKSMYRHQEFESMRELATRVSATGKYASNRIKRWIAKVGQ